MHNPNKSGPSCKRCGDCCRNGGPALHKEDMALIEDGTIELAHIVTLRSGERAYDQINQNLQPLDEEILKIKGRDGRWTCLYYSPEGRACGMYEARPVECEKLFCRDTTELEAMYDKTRLKRVDLLPADHPLVELVTEHDAKCAPLEMEKLAKRAREDDAKAGQALKEMVLFDMEIRRLVVEKGGLSQDMTDFLFGRSLRTLLRNMNINVYEVGDSIRFGFVAGAQS